MRVRCLLTACPGNLFFPNSQDCLTFSLSWQHLIRNCAATEVEVEEREETTLEVSRSHQEVQGRTIGAGESAAAATNWYIRHTSFLHSER